MSTTTDTPAVQAEPAKTIGTALAATGMTGANGTGFGIAPQTFTELQAYCTLISQSDLVPADYRNKPGNVMIAVQMGAEIGLQPMQAIQNIAVIKGRPSVWGDAALALVQARPDCEDIIESLAGTNGDRVATCVVKRRGRTPVTRTFSVKDAGAAGLWGKEGPWKQYPERMLQLRARGFALRDAFPDALKGIAIAEEARDIEVVDRSATTVEPAPEQPAPSAPPQSRTAQLREKIKAKADEGKPDAVDAEFTETPAVNPDELAVGAPEGASGVAGGPLLAIGAAAKRMGVSIAILDSLARKGAIAFVEIPSARGHRPMRRFRPADIDAYKGTEQRRSA